MFALKQFVEHLGHKRKKKWKIMVNGKENCVRTPASQMGQIKDNDQW